MDRRVPTSVMTVSPQAARYLLPGTRTAPPDREGDGEGADGSYGQEMLIPRRIETDGDRRRTRGAVTGTRGRACTLAMSLSTYLFAPGGSAHAWRARRT